MRKILLLSLLSVLLFAYEDADFDGVENQFDRCPNTPFSELVDINGCTTVSLISPHHYDVIVGASYSDSDYQTLNKTDTLSATLQADYYYKNFSLSASTSYYTTEGSGYSEQGLNDSYLSTSYEFKPSENLDVRVGMGLVLPTYATDLNNNNLDYIVSLNLSYIISSWTLFAGYSYSMINDDNVVIFDANGTSIDVVYQDTAAYSLGVGNYVSEQLYISGAYNLSDSIYTSVEQIKTASIYTYYSINEHWFSTFSYAYGLSDTASKNYVALRLGYYF